MAVWWRSYIFKMLFNSVNILILKFFVQVNCMAREICYPWEWYRPWLAKHIFSWNQFWKLKQGTNSLGKARTYLQFLQRWLSMLLTNVDDLGRSLLHRYKFTQWWIIVWQYIHSAAAHNSLYFPCKGKTQNWFCTSRIHILDHIFHPFVSYALLPWLFLNLHAIM